MSTQKISIGRIKEADRFVSCDFLRRHLFIDPNDVPVPSTMTIDYDRRTVTCEEFVRDDKGRPQVDPTDPTTMWRRQVTHYLTEQPPPWPFTEATDLDLALDRLEAVERLRAGTPRA